MGKYRKNVGRFGESAAAEYLRKQNYQILEQNYQCRTGELDIIAKDGQAYVFIEVKTRKDTSYGRPMEAINAYKLRNMVRSVEVYRKMKHLYDVPIRLDAIEVVLNAKNHPVFNHIKNITL